MAWEKGAIEFCAHKGYGCLLVVSDTLVERAVLGLSNLLLHDTLLSPLACWMIGEDFEDHGKQEQYAETK
jgi:hypothetical protein